MNDFQQFKKISNSYDIDRLYIILKHVIWRLRIYNLFCQTFKFRDFKKAFIDFMKSIVVNVFTIFKYFMKQTIY